MTHAKVFPTAVVFMLVGVGPAQAAIAFTGGQWSTTFEYPECTQRGGGGAADCGAVQTDGIYWNWGADIVAGHYTEVAAAANFPGGAGGNGFRAWVDDGTNIQTGFARIDFPSPQPELWLRWYIRYELGFTWGGLNYDKMMWIYTGTPGSNRIPAVVPEWKSDTYAAVAQGSGDEYQVQSSAAHGWAGTMGGSVSDGQFHCIEIYLKMDTDQTDGAGRIWIDGVLVAENTAVNWSAGNTTAQQGWTWIEFFGNQASPANGGAAFVDIDDLAFYTSLPPNSDSSGNPFIGLVPGQAVSTPGLRAACTSATPDPQALPRYQLGVGRSASTVQD